MLNVPKSLERTLFKPEDRQEVRGDHFTAVNNDCYEEVRTLADDSVDMICTSIPFGTQYEYATFLQDFGHNIDNPAFFQQMDYLTPQLLRVLKPGRVAAVHVKDRVMFASKTGLGAPTVDPFSDDTVRHFRQHGFAYQGRITITTDVVRENNQTYRLGYSEMCKDGSRMGVGMPEYVLLFRKLPSDLSDGYADERVTKDPENYSLARWQTDAHAYWRSSGNRPLRPDELLALDPGTLGAWYRKYSLDTVYDYHQHVEMGEVLAEKGRLPKTFMLLAPQSTSEHVWTDVDRMRTLNMEQARKGQEQHVCPLPFDIVERCIARYSMPGETVLDPFGGIGTVPYMAIKMGRKGHSVELNPEYWRMGVGYCRAAEAKQDMPTLFDALEVA